MQGVYSKIKSIEEDGIEDVYCIAVPSAGNFVANGMVIKNCDALRYAIATHKVVVYDPYKQNKTREEYANRYEPTRRNY